MKSPAQMAGKIADHSLLRLSLLALASTLLAACTAVPQSSDEQPEPEVIETEVAIDPDDIEYGSFTEDQLYTAIISELGAQRGQLEDAGENYFDLAFETRDLTIIQRAVQFASVNGDTNALLQLGLLWSQVDTTSPQPHLMLSFQFLESGALEQALSHMARVIELGGSIDFSALAARTGRMANSDRTTLIADVRRLSREYAQQPSIRIALAQLLAQNSEFEEALLELQLLIQLDGSSPNVVLLQAQILQNMEAGTQALRMLRDGVREFEDDKQLRISYARLLIQNEEYEDAQLQFQLLMDRDPQDWETFYSMALLDLEMENYDSASDRFIRLIGVDQRADESQYYLGFIYEQKDDLSRAIEHYRQVQVGTSNYLAAQQQATRFSIQLGELQDAHQWLARQSRGQPRLEILFTSIESSILIQEGHSQEAAELLNTALNKYPNESDLLFARVLYYDSISDRQGSERDLRQIITMQPEDSRALNHLGYMLADQTDRFEEALELLERAIAIAPDDPAIIDSLAWVQYKLGRYPEALRNLRRAFAAFPDHEVASHLGEVLWVMGRKDEANQVWQDALTETPDSELIKEAMQRLQSES